MTTSSVDIITPVTGYCNCTVLSPGSHCDLCGSYPVDLDLLTHFGESVCLQCKTREVSYSFVSYLSCKEEYQLTEDETQSLRCWEKKYVIKSRRVNMRKNVGSKIVKLFLLKHVLAILEQRKGTR